MLLLHAQITSLGFNYFIWVTKFKKGFEFLLTIFEMLHVRIGASACV